MSPRWLFFPTPASGGDDFKLVGSLDTNVDYIINPVFSGTYGSDFTLYGFRPLRISSSYVEVLLLVDTSGTWSSAGNWWSDVSSSITASIAYDGNYLPHTYYSASAGSGSLLRFRFQGTNSAVRTAWGNGRATGDSFEFIMNWT